MEGTQTERPQMTDHEAFIQNTRLMNSIVHEMKLVPELPSEKATDINPLQKVELPEAGGVYTYMEGHPYPYKGFPFFEFVDKIDQIKKIQRGVLSSLYHSFTKRNKLQIAFLLFVPWLFGDFVKAFVYTFYRMVDRFKLKPLRYCTAMRELYRAFSVEFHDESASEKEMRFMVRDVLCMFLEFDNAYRFRFQDIIVELNKDNLNPSKEIVRLLELMMSREKTQEIKDTWRLVRYFLPWYLFFNKSLKKNIVAILKDLDLEKVALSDEDKHYCAERKDYNFGFKLCHKNSGEEKPGSTDTPSSTPAPPLRFGPQEPAPLSPSTA